MSHLAGKGLFKSSKTSPLSLPRALEIHMEAKDDLSNGGG